VVCTFMTLITKQIRVHRFGSRQENGSALESPQSFGQKDKQMPRIPDTDVSLFREIYGFMGDYFTEEEVNEIGAIADRLKVMIESAKQREQEHLKAMGWD
jgi:hypothetical protein